MEPLYKIGDKVRIARRVYPNKDYACIYTDEMSSLEGNVYTVVNVRKNSYGRQYSVPDDTYLYSLGESPANNFIWTSGMLEAVNSTKTYNFIHLSKINKIKLNFKL